MRKIIAILIVLLFSSTFAIAERIIFEIKGSYFSPSDKDFRDIYGGGFMYGGELTIGVYKGLSIWFGANFFSKNGELTFSQEETSLNNSLFGGGLKYNFYSGKGMDVYGGLGLYSFHSKESNVIGEVTKNAVGPVGKLGVNIYVIDKLLFDLFLEYSSCKVKPPDFGVNIGGFSVGIGFGYKFNSNS